MVNRLWMTSSIFLSILFLLSPFTSNPAEAARFDGTNPEKTGCARTARTVRYATLRNPNTKTAYGRIELRYSSSCRTAWARLTSFGPACIPGDDFCGFGSVIRNSDGRRFSCSLQRGRKSCYTAQVNDAGVTSYASGQVDNGAYSGTGKTGSF